ncbi:hypothetical protein ACWA1F_16325 [Flavobacterium sp. 3-218]
MNGIILDKIKEKDSTCYLSKIILGEYVTALSDGYQDYEVQREIVNNTYLDNLVDTILHKKHIPPIVLVVDEEKYVIDKDVIKISEFKILDGLQRTFRIKLIWDTIQYFKDQLDISVDLLQMSRLQLSKNHSENLRKINSNSKILESIINFYKLSDDKKEIDNCFTNYQWFEVWSNLTPQEEVNKMLILNAGHKPVKTQHQLEILFLNLIPILKKANLDRFELVREKDANSTIFSKNRKIGQFHFSHLITGILSLNAGKPITANVNLVHKAQSTDFEIDDYEKYFNFSFLHRFIFELLEFDDSLTKTYGAEGIKWLGREVSIVGVFAALGRYALINSKSPMEILDVFKLKLIQNSGALNLSEFEQVRNNLDLSKVNIGTVNKNAIYYGIYELLDDRTKSLDWPVYFKTTKV